MPRLSSSLTPLLFAADGVAQSSADLPAEELQAMLLDGEIYAIDEAYGLLDTVESPAMRAAALASLAPDRLIAELASASWIHGARDDPPPVHEFCAGATARYRALGLRRISIREVTIGPEEIEVLGGLRVTTPLRTAVDLLRSRATFGADDRMTLLRLTAGSALSLQQIADALRARRHLPAKLRALQRLSEVAVVAGVSLR